MLFEKRKKNQSRELNRLKGILRVDGDALMNIVEIETVVVPEHCLEKVQCDRDDEKDDMQWKLKLRETERLQTSMASTQHGWTKGKEKDWRPREKKKLEMQIKGCEEPGLVEH